MSALKKLKMAFTMTALALMLCTCHTRSETKEAPATSNPKTIRETPIDTSALSAQDPTKHGLD